MNFRRKRNDEPEINLIPFIDVLLVVLIFLMLSTTYSKFTEMQVTLPVADTDTQRDYPKELIVAVGSDGNYSINHSVLAGRNLETVAAALSEASKGAKQPAPQTDEVADLKEEMEAMRRQLAELSSRK